MNNAFLHLFTCFTVLTLAASAQGIGVSFESEVLPLMTAIPRTSDPALTRNGSVTWTDPDTVHFKAMPGRDNIRYAWTTGMAPFQGWDLSSHRALEAEITNTGQHTADVQLWALASFGWEAVCAAASLKPGESKLLSCDLRASFPDGTPKLDPSRVVGYRLMVINPRVETHLQLRHVRAAGSAGVAWVRPRNRLEVPVTSDGNPGAGKRVRYRLSPSDAVHAAVYLPEDWKPGGSYPVIAEYPGNIFFVPDCYSTGMPDHCVIGYGMSEGKGAIWVSLPFVDSGKGRIAENGWGDPDATADFTEKILSSVFKNFGGDASRTVATGFSRGAIACGFIGLRNDRIAGFWRGFHACQHYDGDGWNGAVMADALERARRFKGSSVFQTDNPAQQFQPLMDAMGVKAVWEYSGLGAHACAMFLDDRPSTLALRHWFRELVATP